MSESTRLDFRRKDNVCRLHIAGQGQSASNLYIYILSRKAYSLSPAMLLHAIGLLLLTAVVRGDPDTSDTSLCSTGNCTTDQCGDGNSTCRAAPCAVNGTCAESTVQADSCAPGNSSCVTPVEATSRLLPGVEASGNFSNEKSATNSKFTPSPFLGVIPDHAVGQVFQDTIGPRHTPFTFPGHRGSSREYAIEGGEPYKPVVGSPFQHRPTSVEIQIGTGDPSLGRPEVEVRPHTPYSKPDIEIRPVAGYGKTEIEIRPNPAYGHPEIEIRPQMTYDRPDVVSRPLGNYGKPQVDKKGNSAYEKQGMDLGQQLGFGKPDLTFKPQGVDGSGGKTAQHRQYGKPYDPGNALDFAGYPDGRPSHPFYEAFENMKNLIKPSKGSGPYYFEDVYQDNKPIQEDTGDDPHKQPFPPAGPLDGSPENYHRFPLEHHKHEPEHHHRGGSKWKGLLRFLTTVLPFGLLLAALSPNVLVISPSEEPMVKTPTGHKRSLEAPLGPCGLRRLCEALSESPADFEQFLKAAKEGSTPELKEIIRKAEEKQCASIECGQLQELRPTQPTVLR